MYVEIENIGSTQITRNPVSTSSAKQATGTKTLLFLYLYCANHHHQCRGERAVLKMGLYWGAKRGGDTLMASKWSILMESGCFFQLHIEKC